ncbi:MAG: hypothetical protein MJZ64_05110 [Paludibacteraceae bacterium]|nr:hypothetical protein [Paludibacteraceae bacterium]
MKIEVKNYVLLGSFALINCLAAPAQNYGSTSSQSPSWGNNGYVNDYYYGEQTAFQQDENMFNYGSTPVQDMNTTSSEVFRGGGTYNVAARNIEPGSTLASYSNEKTNGGNKGGWAPPVSAPIGDGWDVYAFLLLLAGVVAFCRRRAKKSCLFLLTCVSAVAAHAQLPFDTELTRTHFNDPQTVISKSANSQWSLTSRIQLGTTLGGIITPEENEAVIALTSEGLADKIYFSHANLGTGTMSVLESTDHTHWTGVWTKDVETSLISGGQVIDDSAQLKSTTRYIKLHYVGSSTSSFGDITVSERKSLSVGSDEIYFTDAMVDDPVQVKTVNVNWTSIVVAVSSTNPSFTLSTTSIGEKNKENQTTVLAITYNHDQAGEHDGQIILEGEGRKAVIAVHGKTSKYDQTITWNETLGTYPTNVNLTLHAFSNQGLPIQYTSSDSSIAYVDEYAHVVPVCAGTVTLSAQQPGNYKYNATEIISKQLTLERIDPAIAVSAAGIVYGQKVKESVLTELNKQVPGTLSWLDLDPEAVLDAGTYTAQVLFTPDNTCSYNTATRNVLLTVDKADQAISWTQPVTEFNEGDITDLTAAATSSLPVSYAMTNCIVDIDGNTMEALEEGQTIIIAFQPGNNNYNPATVAMQAFTIHKASPVPTRNEPITLEFLQQNGTKYIHNDVVYFNYGGVTYDAQGKTVR